MADDKKIVDRLKAEGDLLRNKGTNSIKSVKEKLDKFNGVFESIETSIKDQTTVLTNIFDLNKEEVERQKQLADLNRVSSDTSPVVAGGIGGILGATLKGAKGAAAGAGNVAGGIGSILGGIGGAAGGIGKGVGFAAGGIGIGLMGLSQFMESMPDAQTIKDNVETLLSIGEGYESRLSFFTDSTMLAGALGGLGTALVAFGAGQAAVGIAEIITSWSDGNWAENVKNNVLTLLSISEAAGGNLEVLKDGGALSLALTGLGIGLGAFGAGAAVGGIGEIIANWSAGGNWAEGVKNNVLTLLSIADELDGSEESLIGESGKFALAMTGLGIGLAAFGVGAGVAGIADIIADWGSESGGWAQGVKDNVSILLSISDDVNAAGDSFVGESSKFAMAMTGLGAGLAAFAIGAGVNGIVEILADWGSESGNWAQDVKNNVETLLSIGNSLGGDVEGTFGEGSGKFFLAMTGIAAGLNVFAGGNLSASLINVGSAIVDFLAGGGPIDKIISLAENSENLMKGGEALEKIANALDTFSKIRISNMRLDFAGMAEDIAGALPLLQGLSKGGVVGEGFWSSGIDFGPEMPDGQGGILNPALRLDEIAAKIAMVQNALAGISTFSSDIQTGGAQATAGNLQIEPQQYTAGTVIYQTIVAAGPDQIQQIVDRLSDSSNSASNIVVAPVTNAPVTVVQGGPTSNASTGITTVIMGGGGYGGIVGAAQ